MSVFTIRKFIFFTKRMYIKDVIRPILLVSLPSFILLYYLNIYLPINLIGLIAMLICGVLATIGCSIFVLPKSYRHQFVAIIKRKLK